MREEEYIKMAYEKLSDSEIMDSYWDQVATKRIWASSSTGEKVKFSELELGHIKSIIRGLLQFKNPNCKKVVFALYEELEKRIKMLEREVQIKKPTLKELLKTVEISEGVQIHILSPLEDTIFTGDIYELNVCPKYEIWLEDKCKMSIIGNNVYIYLLG